MPIRYTTKEILSLVREIENEAKQAGILLSDHKLVFKPGNASQGIAATIAVRDSGNFHVPGYGQFLPNFNHKSGPAEQYRLLMAVLNVFYALRNVRNEMTMPQS